MTWRAGRWAALAAMAFAAVCATAAETGATGAAGPGPLAPGDARLCFYRETWHALSVQPDVTVSGQVVGKAYPNEWFCADRKPGTYEISTVSEPDRKFSVTLVSRRDALCEPRIHGDVVPRRAHQSGARRQGGRREEYRRTALPR